MADARGPWLALLISLAALSFCTYQLNVRFHFPFSPMTASLNSPETALSDVAGVVLGLRRVSADLAWIQTQQYYGTAEADVPEADAENGMGLYPRFKAMCERVAHIDPYFTYLYYYGGAVLGWNLNRLTEAEELLKEGIAHNPAEWRLPQYLAALSYQKNHDMAKLSQFLETIVSDPQCPLLMKALLANLYKKQGLYQKAYALWETIYESGDPAYAHRAIEETGEIRRLATQQGLDSPGVGLVH